MKYWIKERHNPQFDKPYYVAYGKASDAKAAKMKSHTLYGSVVMLGFASEQEYEAKLSQLRADGYDVRVGAI